MQLRSSFCRLRLLLLCTWLLVAACGDPAPKSDWVRSSLLLLEKQLLALFDYVVKPKLQAARQEWKREQEKRLAAPRSSPVIEVADGVVRIDGKELVLPSPGTRWVETLGPATMPWRDLKHGVPTAGWNPGCVFVWDQLGLVANGMSSVPLKDQSPETCSIYGVEVFLDNDEQLLLNALDNEGRARRPRQSFPGTLIVEGVRIENRMSWRDVYRGIADDVYLDGKEDGYRCNESIGSSRSPKTKVACWKGPIHYRGLLVWNASEDSGKLWGFSVTVDP